jgi:hypothetical protein
MPDTRSDPYQAESALDGLKNGELKLLHLYLGQVNASTVSLCPYVRFCRLCAFSDQTNYGETYWRRAHQLPGALICTKHKEVLKLSRAKMFPTDSEYFQDATASINSETSRDCAQFSSQEFELAADIAARCVQLLRLSPTPWASLYPHHLYRQGAVISQNPKGLSRMVHGDIAKEFIKFFGTKFLTKLGCKFSRKKLGRTFGLRVLRLTTRSSTSWCRSSWRAALAVPPGLFNAL